MNLTSVKSALKEAIDRNWDSELAFLARLVHEPSTRGQTNGAQDLVANELRRLQADVSEVGIDLDRLADLPGYSPVDWSYEGLRNVVGRLPGVVGGARSLVLNGHVDVVSAEPLQEWESGPWDAHIRDGRMFGRGACDMKAGVAAMVFALGAVRDLDLRLKGDALVQTVIDEECSGNGTLACLAAGYGGDGAIIPEPFGLSIVSASTGVLWCRVQIRGAGGHASDAHEAVNPIDKAYVLIHALRELESQWNLPQHRHRAFADVPHPLNFNIGVIRGGDWPSSVPQLCTFEARLSCFPGQSLSAVKQDILSCLAAAADSDPWLRRVRPEATFIGFHAEGAVYDTDCELARIVAANHEHTTGKAVSLFPFTGTIDNRFFQLYYQTPTVCYGPTGGQVHAPNEWVDLESVRQCTRVLAGAVVDWCGVE